VQDDQSYREKGDLAVVTQDDVDAVRCGHPLEPGDQDELYRDLREANEAECYGELEPEPTAGRDRRHEHQEDRGEHDQQIQSDPEKSGYRAVHARTHREAPAPTVVTTQSASESAVEIRAIEAREVVTTDAEAAALPTQRGSFWWYVAILVVAGVILAVVL
jgi:site-specific DNA-cytosine methylase